MPSRAAGCGAGLDGTDLSGEIAGLAQLASAAAGAHGCLLLYRAPLIEGAIWAASDVPPRHLPAAPAWELTTRWPEGGFAVPVTPRVAPSDCAVARSLGIEIEDSATLALWRYREDKSAVCVALVSAIPGKMTKAVAELSARGALALIRARCNSDRALFWRTQAGGLRDNLIAAGTQASRIAREHASERAADRRLISAAQRGNLRAVAAELARLGPFEGWLLVAREERGGPRITAAHRVPGNTVRESDAELRRILRQRTIVGRTLPEAAALSGVERPFQSLGYRAYLCVPLEDAALVLLSRRPLRAAARARVADRRRIIAPYLKNLFLAHEMERQRALLRSLVRGLFAAADAERASFRRDLHDDFAQLLAGARIAIGGKSEDARRFFRELEGETRKRLDALRPSQPHGANLKAAIAAELRRLGHTGIEATSSVRGLSRVPATVKEVLRRVIGEGVSNVIRHAQADRVHLEIECKDGIAVAAVTDNGRGVNGNGVAGSGLRGLSERVAILGGSCKLDSKPGATRLSAQIPVANL